LVFRRLSATEYILKFRRLMVQSFGLQSRQRSRHRPKPLSLVIFRAFLLASISFGSSSSITVASVSAPPQKLRATIPEMASCQQLVTVTTTNWEDVNATVRLYERNAGAGANWRRVGSPFPAVIGQRGLAWGIGLHGSSQPGEPRKREGDKKAPAGVFRFGDVFGTAHPEQVRFLRLPYRQLTPSTEAIDDPRSKYYNQVVDRTTITHPDWSSSESMLQVGGRYRLGVIIQHNAEAYPGLGSCIFFHVWDPHYSGTTGCTSAAYSQLVRVLRWLDPQKKPLIVQLPASEYERLKQRWGLPSVSARQ